MKGKIFAVAMVTLLAAGSLLTITGCGNSGGPTSFTWWIATGDVEYYDDYEENPVVEYITSQKQFKGEDGEMKNISFEFVTPANTSSAASDFNNMIANNESENIMDPNMYSGSIAALYEDNRIIDLTPYATDPEVMPNLAAWIEENRGGDAEYIYNTLSNGERKILAIPQVYDVADNEQQAFGFQYRRDWLVKYGTQPDTFYDPMGIVNEDYMTPTANPNAGKSFSGRFTENTDGSARNDTPSQSTELPEGANGDSWVDDVVFPSGGDTPVYISDWEWMFEIYEKAFNSSDFNRDDPNFSGYMTSVYAPGYNANGDLSSGFGGGGVYWYKDGNNDAAYGMTETGFRAYLECMNHWYEEGWLDQKFTERASDNFYAIDNTAITAGNVPIWMGNANRVGTRMATESGNAKGAIVFCCATPINDIPAYDGDPSTDAYTTQATTTQAETAMSGGAGSDYMLQIPRVTFQNERIAPGAVISTETAEEKDLILLLSFFDYLFSEEGMVLSTMGLSKEQVEESDSDVYYDNGLSEGAYTVVGEGENVKYQYNFILEQNQYGIRNAMTSRLPGLRCISRIQYSFPETYLENRAQWTKYEATGFIGSMLGGQLTPGEADKVDNVRLPIEDNLLKPNVYKFITGETGLDNASWSSFCSRVMSYRNKNTTVADVTAAYQAAFDRMYGQAAD